MSAVAGMGSHVELEERSAPSVALRAEIDSLEQMISPGERTTCDVEPILPVAPLDRLIKIPRFNAVRGTDLVDLLLGPVRHALADNKFSPLRSGRKAPNSGSQIGIFPHPGKRDPRMLCGSTIADDVSAR